MQVTIEIDAALLRRAVVEAHGGRIGETCPVALAIKAAYPSLSDVWVGNTRVIWDRKAEGIIDRTALIPSRLVSFIIEFDNYFCKATKYNLPEYGPHHHLESYYGTYTIGDSV